MITLSAADSGYVVFSEAGDYRESFPSLADAAREARDEARTRGESILLVDSEFGEYRVKTPSGEALSVQGWQIVIKGDLVTVELADSE